MKYNYIHKEETHNLAAPEKIVPIIYDLIHPESVVDFGCGIGTFLYAFKEAGVSNVLGIDGEWADKKLLAKYLKSDEFLEGNLSEYIPLENKYDLAICLEVAEHIEEKSADNLIKSLANASDVVLFSAAIPLQSGQFHVNEQWPTYWAEKFLKYDFYFNDIIRPAIWNTAGIEFWYKQNIFLVTHKKYPMNESLIKNLANNSMTNIVHPDLFGKKAASLNSIMSGEKEIAFYLKLLFKAFLVKFHLYKTKSDY